jgi:perosamine synthetase
MQLIPQKRETKQPVSRRSEYLAFGKPNFSDEEIAAVTRVLRSGWVGMGPETIAFEKELAEYLKAEHVVTVNSCTSALFLSLLAHGIGPGDEVICPDLTWCSTANAALYAGATPVLCDVEPGSFSVSADTISAAVTEKTKAVVVVHFGGLAIDVMALRKALPAHVSIIEDAAHALGATYPDGQPVGSSGNLACFSFYANKNLATGDGGAIAVRDEEQLHKLQLLRNQGLSSDAWKRYSHPVAALTPGVAELGYKMNLIDLLACIGRIQLRRQPEFSDIRLALAKRYVEALSASDFDFGFQNGIISSGHARHLFVVRIPIGKLALNRNEVVLELRARNVGAAIHYAPLHTMPFYEQFGRGKYPNTEALAPDIVTLPIGASMSLDDADYVVGQLLAVLRAARG